MKKLLFSSVLTPLLAMGLFLLVGCAATLHRAIDPAARVVQGGREVKVSVTQGEIRADIQPSGGGQAFGLIGALVDAGVNQSRAKDAEKTVKTLRDALAGFDFDTLAVQRTKETLDKLDWFGAKDVVFGKEFTNAKQMEQLDAAKTPQVLFADYAYSVSPDFSVIRVAMTATIAMKAPQPGQTSADRIKAGNLIYIQQFLNVVPLAFPSKDAVENSRRWAADGAKLARTALDSGLAGIQQMFERSLRRTPQDVINLDSAESVTVGEYAGKLIDRSGDGTLLRDQAGQWVFVTAKAL